MGVDIRTYNYNNERKKDGVAYYPTALVLHITDGNFDSTVSWFTSPRSQVSAHWIVNTDGKIYSVVDEADTAWHAGRVVRPTWEGLKDGINPNLYTVGVEVIATSKSLPPWRQWVAWVRLCKAICTRWDIPMDKLHIVNHNEINGGKTCPSYWFNRKWLLILSKFI